MKRRLSSFLKGMFMSTDHKPVLPKPPRKPSLAYRIAAFLMATGIAAYPAVFVFAWLDTTHNHVVTQLTFYVVLLISYRTILNKHGKY